MTGLECIEKTLSGCRKTFSESIDLALNLNLNSKKTEQNIKFLTCLPNPIPKVNRILIIDNDLSTEELSGLTFEHYGSSDMIDKILGGWLEFDTLITTPKMMPLISKVGKILGPKGLMPNPKLGTVTNDLKGTIKEFNKGKVLIKSDSCGNVHVPIGKANFDPEKIKQNLDYMLELILQKKPSTVKGKFIKSIHISSTMGESHKCTSQ